MAMGPELLQREGPERSRGVVLGPHTRCFPSGSASVVLHNLLMEIEPEAVKSSTGHCNAFEGPAGDTLRRVRSYSS